MAIRFDGESAPCSVDEGLPWTPSPHSELVSVKLYAADPARGEIVILLRASPGVELPAHRSTGQTTILTLQGRWQYREHDWVAGPGSVVIEPAGVPHTPQILPDGTDDVILFIVADGDLLFYWMPGARSSALKTAGLRSQGTWSTAGPTTFSRAT